MLAPAPRSRQPRGIRRTVVQVVRENRRRIQEVIEVESDVRPSPAEAQYLRQSDIEFFYAVAIQRSWLDQIHSNACEIVRQRSAQRLLNLRPGCRSRLLGDCPVCRNRSAPVAAERPREQYIDLWNGVRSETGISRDPACAGVAPGIGWSLNAGRCEGANNEVLLWNGRPDVAVIRPDVTCAHTALKHDAVSGPGADVEQDTIRRLRIGSVRFRESLHGRDRRCDVLVYVVQSGDRPTLRLGWQAGIVRRSDGELAEIRRPPREFVGASK